MRQATPVSGDVGEQYAFDPAEKPKVGHRSRERTAVGMTEVRCDREVARYPRGLVVGKERELAGRPGSHHWHLHQSTIPGTLELNAWQGRVWVNVHRVEMADGQANLLINSRDFRARTSWSGVTRVPKQPPRCRPVTRVSRPSRYVTVYVFGRLSVSGGQRLMVREGPT